MATAAETATRELFTQLKPGDRVEVVQTVRVGMQSWTTTTRGTVVKTERRRHSLHFKRNYDDKVFSDLVVLKLDDGSLTTLAIDEFTVLTRL
jgi:hypothetical protein